MDLPTEYWFQLTALLSLNINETGAMEVYIFYINIIS